MPSAEKPACPASKPAITGSSKTGRSSACSVRASAGWEIKSGVTAGSGRTTGGYIGRSFTAKACSVNVDPIEKKPFFHVLPGANALSIATAGCNVNCKFCQNWEISQVRAEQVEAVDFPPEAVVRQAETAACPAIAYTYTEPVVFFEYMVDTAAAARRRGIKSLVVTAGHINPEPLAELLGVADAIKIDLKAFDARFYETYVRGDLKPVLDAVKAVAKSGVWLEIVYLVIPTLNDDPEKIGAMSRWLRDEAGPDVPLHFSRFHPMYLVKNLPSTPVQTLERLHDVARAEGLRPGLCRQRPRPPRREHVLSGLRPHRRRTLRLRNPPDRPQERRLRKMREDHPRRLDLRPALPALSLGWLASTAQIYLLREFSAQFHGSELTYALVLAAWLFWGGVGSAVAGRLRSARPATLLHWQAAAVFLLPIVFLALRFSRGLLGLVPGESAGMGAAFLFAAGAGLVLSLPLGVLFAINVQSFSGDAGRAYLLESAGAALGGLAVHFVLIPLLPSSAGAAAAAWLSLAAAAAGSREGKRVAIPAAAAIVMILWTATDGATLRAAWRPFRIVETLDSRYSRLSVVETGDQVTLYSDGQRLFTSGDRAGAEEAVHFALLQRPEARDVLLIGGGAGGAAAEALKYPLARPDYVELDPEILQVAMRHLPDAERRALEDPRLDVIVRDGRAFIQSSGPPYDAVLMNLPEPSTAQLNRYYTREFFAEVHGRIRPGGVFSFTVPGAENYLSADRRDFLASLLATLREVFPEVRVVPGATQVFLASASELTLDSEELSDRVSRLGLETSSLTPAALRARLNPLRLAAWRDSVESRPGRLNRDLSPISYYFGAVLWASQFRGLEAGLLRAAADWPVALLLGSPLAVAALVLAFMARGRARAPGRSLAPLAVYGLTSIVAEFVLLVAYQAASGLVYGKIALLLGAFMAGLAGGAALARRARFMGRINLVVLQVASAMMIGLCLLLVSARRAEPAYFLALLGFGLVGGALFIEAAREAPADRKRAGRAYAVELFGSSLGALFAAAFVIPLAGVPAALGVLAGLNLLALGYLVLTSRSRSRLPTPGR